MATSVKTNGELHKPPLEMVLRFGNRCETNPPPIAEHEKIPIGLRQLTFSDIVAGCEKLLRQGIGKYGSKAESEENNLHQAKLALWNTIVSGVPYREFRARFFKEMRRAARNDNKGMAYFERKALRLDNKTNHWHDAIADRKSSLNLHLMAHPYGSRSNYRIKQPKDPKIARRAARKMAKKRREWRSDRLSELAETRGDNERREERIEIARAFRHLMLQHMLDIQRAAIERPFLMKPGMVLSVLRHRAKEDRSHYGVVRPKTNELRSIRLLMGRVNPADPVKVEQFEPRHLEDDAYKAVKAKIGAISESYRTDMGTFAHIREYLAALNTQVTLQTAIPEEIRKDLEEIRVQRRNEVEREYEDAM